MGTEKYWVKCNVAIRVDPRSSGDHLRIPLIDFKACRIGQPDFEIKFIDFFASNVIKTRVGVNYMQM